MTRGIKVDVGDGWAAIVLKVIVIGSAYPKSWNFRFHRAWRNSGRMRIYVTTDSGDPESLKATVELSKIAWESSGYTCEVCGRGAHLRLGQRYALTLCRDHEHLVGERHPDDGRVRDPWARHVGQSPLPEVYDDPASMRDTLLRMWLDGTAATGEVMQLVQMSWNDLLEAAYGGGYEIDLEDDPDAEEKGAAMARMIAGAKDEGTRH